MRGCSGGFDLSWLLEYGWAWSDSARQRCRAHNRGTDRMDECFCLLKRKARREAQPA